MTFPNDGTSGTRKIIGLTKIPCSDTFSKSSFLSSIKKRQDLNLEKSHMALVLFDCFRGQTSAAIESLLQQNHIVAVQISPNCTDNLQPMGMSINKPVKDGMRTKFQTWYASEVQKQLKDVPVDQVKVGVTVAAITTR